MCPKEVSLILRDGGSMIFNVFGFGYFICHLFRKILLGIKLKDLFQFWDSIHNFFNIWNRGTWTFHFRGFLSSFFFPFFFLLFFSLTKYVNWLNYTLSYLLLFLLQIRIDQISNKFTVLSLPSLRDRQCHMHLCYLCLICVIMCILVVSDICM